MKNLLLIILLTMFTFNCYSQYVADELGEGFFKQTLVMEDDYEGSVVATLIKYVADSTRSSDRSILYVHGFNEYFFQAEEAKVFDAAGYNFYALDLRKYGRSLRHKQKQFNVRNVNEYYEEIEAAINIIKKEGATKVFLMGHSTGGLITTLFTKDKGLDIGVDGLVLNSPFYEQNLSWFVKKIAIPVVAFISHIAPNVMYKQSPSIAYTESIHRKYSGEWDYDLTKKPAASPSVSYSWIRAISKAQRKIRKIDSMEIPTIVLHSDKSTDATVYCEELTNSDCVLNVEDIAKHTRHMGVEEVVIEDGLHDLALSRKDVRDNFYSKAIEFLDKL